VKNSKYWRSATSMPPAPLPTITPAPGSPARNPASRQASLAAMTPMSDAREYRRGSGRPPRSAGMPGARSSIAIASSMVTCGTGAATVQPYGEASNSVMVCVALQPRRTCCQNRSRPTP
jgi:hypothetical protein